VKNMIVGCVKEIKNSEFRVGLTPASVKEYVKNGHKVFIQSGAGIGSSYADNDYISAGASILHTAKEVWDISQMIVKVKEPLEEEFKYFRCGLIIFTYLHLAADEKLTKALLDNKVIGIAYETIKENDGSLPCLKPMSQVAGRLAVIEGAKYLQSPYGGRGLLIGGVPGVEKANCVVIGAGIVGENSISYLVGLQANVTVLDINVNRLETLSNQYKNKITTLYNNENNLIKSLKEADLVISSVLLPGARAPKVIKREYYAFMKKGAVIVDVAIDQGGSTEVSKPTTQKDQVFVVDGIIHYCVANMPGAVSLTSTQALNNATIKYGLEIANKGYKNALLENKALYLGLNTYNGKVTCLGVAKAFSLPYNEFSQLV